MSGVFTLTREGKIIMHKDSITLCPILDKLTDDELKYIIISYDYISSPYARKPIEERKEMALKEIGLDNKSRIENRADMKKAIPAYKSLIYESKRATIDAFTSKIDKLNKAIFDTDNHTDITAYDKSISILQKRIDSYEEELQKEDEIIELKGNKKLSLIEVMMRNRKLYDISIKK